MLKRFIGRHFFKIFGASSGLIPGLGIFGLIFGFIAGTFIDQLTAGIRVRRHLKTFINDPGSAKESSQPFINASALIIGWHLCMGELARKTLFSSASSLYFPKAPSHCLEILSEGEQPGLKTQANAAAQYFGRYSSDEEKNRLQELLRACGCASSADHRTLLETAGISSPGQKTDGHNREEDYAVLGLQPGASVNEVKSVYHKLAAQFHPDGSRHLSDIQQKITEDAFIRIKSAYERLLK